MKIKWCFEQKGVELIDKKEHLSESYMKEADETLENMYLTKGKWKVITAYYSCYNAIYSLLMKVGIKCEIPDCTIELMELFGFSLDDIEFMKDLKDDRIKNQYYLKNIELKNESKVKEFVLKCKEKLLMNDSDVENIRKKIKEMIE